MADRKQSVLDRDSHPSLKESKQDEPPNSRLFIVCGKSVTEDDFREAFHKYGTIEEIWMVKDRTTGEPKGVAYIKFSKTSEAATAMEEMNGRCIGCHPRPLKVLIAHSREQGSRRDSNEEERLLRLFVVVPKSMNDSELRDHFAQFGDIDYVSIVKDKNTKESKGFAYVKYHRVSHTAKAFECCERSFKPVFADPRPPKPMHADSSQSNIGSASSTTSNYDVFPYENHTAASTEGFSRLAVVASSSVNQDQLWKLFDIIPGLDYCEKRETKNRQQGRCQYTAVYNNAQAASYAKEKLHGFEYPPGQRLIVKFDYINSEPTRSTSTGTLPTSTVQSSVQYAGVNCLTPVGSGTRLPFLSGLQGQGGMESNVQPVPTTNPSPVGAPYHGLISNIAPNNAARTAALHNNLATLAETIAQATSLIQAAGLGQGFLQSPSKHAVNGADERNDLMGHLEMLGALSTQGIPLSPNQAPTNNNYPGETYDPSYCSVKLPTPQPLAPMDSPVGERLFIVCQPTPPPIYVLKDIFGRFGHLIDVYMLGGRSCGYAKYADKDSADRALMTLHGQEVCGSRLKVMTAEPPNATNNDTLRKRIRIEEQ
uniref:RRM domain-containing protein n=1 Tax=Daphnia galeata TaxID=27404 RepID=A0A8J2WKA2_9CRUS|nr:unnamed protein product [Daphnia galeata]